MNVLADLIDLGGAGLEIIELEGAAPTVPEAVGGVVRVGVHRGGTPPGGGLDGFDILLSVDPLAPGPWVGLAPSQLEAALDRLSEQATRRPVATTVAAQVFRLGAQLDLDQALVLESLAYSLLLASGEFGAWRAANPARTRAPDDHARIRLEANTALTITLDRPEARNAFDARMRDELCEALDFALAHPEKPPVVLQGAGPAFSAGGDLDEFGRATDLGQAHLIRTLRSAARRAAHLGDRLTARLHGHCIGAGIEVPAAAGRVTARPGAIFRLPEVGMGLIPGAGGTATIPRRIGRRRACYMAISGVDVDLATALAWGLVDEVAA